MDEAIFHGASGAGAELSRLTPGTHAEAGRETSWYPKTPPLSAGLLIYTQRESVKSICARETRARGIRVVETTIIFRVPRH